MIQGNHIVAPINIADPYNLMGVSKLGDFYDLAYICKNTHGKINENSLYKPIEFGLPSEIPDDYYYQANFGYSIPKYNDYAVMAENYNTKWTYQPPTTWCRITDFLKYDHGAKYVFDMDVHNNPAIMGKCYVSLRYSPVWLTNWKEWSTYTGTNLKKLMCGFFVPERGFFILTDNTLPIDQLDDSNTYITIDRFFNVGQTYNFYFVLTDWMPVGMGHGWYKPTGVPANWWIVNPGNPQKFKVLAEERPIDSVEASVSSGGTNIKEQDGYYIFYNTNFELSVRNGSNQNLSLSAEIYADNVVTGSTSGSVKIGEITGTTFIAYETKTFTINYPDELKYAVIGQNALPIRIVFKSGTITKISVVHVPVINGKITRIVL